MEPKNSFMEIGASYAVSTGLVKRILNHIAHGGIVKRKLRRMMMSTGSLIRLWDYCWDYICTIISHTASGQLLLDGSTPYEKVHGYTPDISELTSFHWYEWVWYHEPNDPDKFQLGR